jgi:peptidoglycan/xylan/chitin deacetylase (PgdA/CDA1 family)
MTGRSVGLSSRLLDAGIETFCRAIESVVGRRSTVLIFHRVLEAPDPLNPSTPDAATFERLMRQLQRQFNVVPLAHIVESLESGKALSRGVAITFDDGYADNALFAAPILARLGMHATFFVATGYLDGGVMWNDRVIEGVRTAPGGVLDLRDLGLVQYPIGDPDARVNALDRLLTDVKYLDPARREVVSSAIVERCGARLDTHIMMTSDQVRQLFKRGMTIGGHTDTHPILARIDESQARSEIVRGKQILEAIIGSKVEFFAYPNGTPGKDFHQSHALQVKAAGFRAAVTTVVGSVRRDCNPFLIPRFTPWRRDSLGFSLQMARNLAMTSP